MNFIPKIFKELSEIRCVLEKLEKKQLTNNQKIFLGLNLRDILQDIKEKKEQTEKLITDLESTNIDDKIQEKELEIQGYSEFVKTFAPLMLLYNFGLVNRNW
jgi:hypothetical protein